MSGWNQQLNGRPYWYILDGHTPIPAPDIETVGRFLAEAERQVARTRLTPEVEVSTVFLCLDHSLGLEPDTPPLLFETMVFGGTHDGFAVRYSTWDAAARGHGHVCQEMLAALVPVVTLPGAICETCFDAPATALVPAPHGNEMGICATCLRATAAPS